MNIIYNLFYAVILFSSLAILCLILWDLSKKPEDEPEERQTLASSKRSESMPMSSTSRSSSINQDDFNGTVPNLLRTKDTGRTFSVNPQSWRSEDDGTLIIYQMYRMRTANRPENFDYDASEKAKNEAPSVAVIDVCTTERSSFLSESDIRATQKSL